MCNSVHFGGRVYSTPAELSGLIGGVDKLIWQEQSPTGIVSAKSYGGVDKLIWQEESPFVSLDEGKERHVLDLCLCPVDLGATLDAAGFIYRRGDDPMEWFVEEKQP